LVVSIGIVSWITKQEIKKGEQIIQKTENNVVENNQNADTNSKEIKNKNEASQALADADRLMEEISKDNLQDN
jgi:hypothetical protein